MVQLLKIVKKQPEHFQKVIELTSSPREITAINMAIETAQKLSKQEVLLVFGAAHDFSGAIKQVNHDTYSLKFDTVDCDMPLDVKPSLPEYAINKEHAFLRLEVKYIMVVNGSQLKPIIQKSLCCIYGRFLAVPFILIL